MANSTVMTTVSDFKKYLKECLDKGDVVESNYEDNVLSKIAHDWLNEHYSSNQEKYNYHVYLVWFVIRELLQTNFKENPTITDTIATALKYPDEFKKCHNNDSDIDYNKLKQCYDIDIEFNPDDSMKKCIHDGFDTYNSCIVDVYKIVSIARALRMKYYLNHYDGDFSLPEGKEYSGILFDDVIVDITVHQKSTYDMLCDLRDYLQRCYESDDLLLYDGSPEYVDLTDIVIASILKVTGVYDYWHKRRIHMKEWAYTIWFAVIAWLLKGYRESTVETVREIFDSAFYDFESEHEKFEPACKYNDYFIKRNYKEYLTNKPKYYRCICNIHYFLLRFEECIAKYNNTIKPDDAINPPFDLDREIKIEQKPVYKGVSINNIEKLAVYKDNLIEFINNMVEFGTTVKGFVDVFVAGQFDYDTFNNAVEVLNVIRDEAKECAPQFRIIY